VHPKERNSVEHPDPRSGPGCTPSRRGYRAVTPPVTSEPRQTPPRIKSAATIGGEPQADRQDRPAKAGPSVSDRASTADETAQPARLERSGRRARSGRDGLRR